jgi:predicted enzyme related to lactoylglutathione lyase
MDATNKIDYIEIQASNVEATRSFFQQLFGWKFEDYGPDYSAFSDGRLSGGITRADAHASIASGSVLIVFYHTNLEDVRQHVLGLGGGITKDIYAFPGGRRFHFAEPSGNEFAVWSDT